MENLLKNLEGLREKAIAATDLLAIERKRVELMELKKAASQPNFWDDQTRAIETNKKIEELDSEINTWDKFLQEVRELEELVAVANKEGDSSIAEEADKKYEELKKELIKNFTFYFLKNMTAVTLFYQYTPARAELTRKTGRKF